MRTPELGAARAVTTIAGSARRRATIRSLAVVAGSGVAAALAATGSPGRAGVALVGGATLGGLPTASGRLTRRWPLALGVVAAVVVGVAVAGDDPGPGLTLVGALAGGLAALAAAGLAGVRWWTWTGIWSVAAAAAVTALLVVPDGAAVHRLAVVALAAALLVAVARGLSKLALRLVAVALAVAALASLAWIGDRAPAAGPTDTDRAEAGAALTAFADEAATLRDELPCTGRSSRAPDVRLCAELTSLAADANRGARRRDVAAVAPLATALDRLREDVAVRVVATDVEAAARIAAAERRTEQGAEGTATWADAARVEPTERRDLRQLTARGVDRVVADTFEPLVGERTVARLGTAGWVVLAVLLALGYRRLEVINNRRYGGPVAVAEVATAEGAAAGLAPELTAAIRNRVAELELRAPAPVPGADPALKPTADIVAGLGADPAPAAGRLAAALTAVKHAVVPVPGVRVVPAYATLRRPRAADGEAGEQGRDHGREYGRAHGHEAEGLDDGGGHDTPGDRDGEAVDHVMAVRLVTPDGRRTLRAASFTRSSAAAAAQAAADFAVCDALGRSSLTPSWARWWSEDGTALAPYQAVVADTGRHGPRLALRRQIELLETVRASSPGTGLALVELGHRYELDERPLDALRSHLTARLLHPRFAQARYRVAASLSMLAAPGRLEEHWLDEDRADERREVADLLVESGLVERARRSRLWRVVKPRCPDDPDSQREWLAQDEPSPGARRDVLKVFLLVAHTELAAMERRLSYPGLLAGACRQSERHVWLQLLAQPARRRAAVERYRSARWIAELRLALLPAEPGTDGARHLQRKVDAMAERPDAGSTALYNAACFTAVLAERSPAKGDERVELQQRAVRYLARVALRGRGPVPSSGWLTTDPDLVSLQAVPAFNDLVRRLADDEERHSATTAGTPV